MADLAQGLLFKQGFTQALLTQANEGLHSLSDEQPLGGGGPKARKLFQKFAKYCASKRMQYLLIFSQNSSPLPV